MRKTGLVLCLFLNFSLFIGFAMADEVGDFIASDANQNKMLEGEEFKAFIKRRAAAGNASAKWVVRFGAWGRALKTVDTNGDKIITPAELRAYDAKD